MNAPAHAASPDTPASVSDTAPTDEGLRVRSETGRLRRAIVHTPGAELSNVSPSNHRAFGLNDLLYERYAREEHDALVRLLREVWGVDVLRFRELLTASLDGSDAFARARLAEEVAVAEGLDSFGAERLLAFADGAGAEVSASLAERLIAGEPVRSTGSVEEFLSTELYHLAPLPNMMLVRDLGVPLGEEMLVAWHSERNRRRETVLWRFVLGRASPVRALRWEDWTVRDAGAPEEPTFTLDGGNVMQASERVLLVGHSGRPAPAAVERLIGWLGERCRGEAHVFVVRLPEPINHLDTVFAMLGDDDCLVYPPALIGNGPESVDVLHVALDTHGVARWESPRELLGPLREALGRPLRAIPCGGPSPLDQRREQWWGGACLLAVEPGRLIAFRSASRTVEELERCGYVRLDSDTVLAGGADPRAHELSVVVLGGAELSRAGGGPRSFVLPLVRDDA